MRLGQYMTKNVFCQTNPDTIFGIKQGDPGKLDKIRRL